MPTKQLPSDDAVINQFRTAQVNGDTVYKQTVGYGDQYPRNDANHIVIKQTNSVTGVHHRYRELEKGYDLTKFGEGQSGAKRFLQVLKSVDLNPPGDFFRVYRDLGRGCETTYPPSWLYLWANEEVMIATTSNPINGDSTNKNTVGREGYAGYVGIGGKTAAVKQAESAVEALATTIKDKNETGLFY